MHEMRRQLQEVDENSHDLIWLRSRQKHLYTLFNRAILMPPLAIDAIEILCRVYTQLDTQEQSKAWQYILLIALEEAAELKDTTMQAQLYLHLAPEYLATGEHSPAKEVFLNALSLRNSLTPDIRLLATLGVMKAESLYHKDNGDDFFMKEAEAIARQVSQQNVLAIYREALALTCLAHGDLRPALENALLAVCLWHHLNRYQKIIDATFILADVYRYSGQMPAYQACIEFLTEYVDPQNTHDQALLNYHMGAYHFYEADYSNSAGFYQQALKGFKVLKFRMLTHATQQALALSLYYLGDLETADTHLEKALTGWNALKNDYQVMSAYYTQAYGHHLQQQFTAAVRFYEQSLSCQHNLSNTTSDLDLISTIKDNLALAQAGRLPL